MWRKLRNCYLNAINRRQGKNIPKWKYEDEMSFLLPFIEIRSPENDTELHSQSSSLSNLSVSYNEGNVDNSMFSEREDSPEMILPGTSNLIPKKEPEDEMHDVLPAPKRKINFRRDRVVERPVSNTVHDETEMFFLSISETVKRLPPIDQAKIKMELCKLVYEAEIRQLESRSGNL
ncbi:uncharacterized protein LOC118184107 [Stegodyphus dumicola]|uniref:uncharacterized protein LOC118184107 n=1 Tax=Stegodyphus dumicola TaxID=202533 RepID=UPI0015AB2DA0|nr:uncharacterized protein LOC118184107 [Stegodyphus dumicola]XP_035209650.1 uncharacterized protein LOC118184107 [Stegodyphus dumicola]